MVLPPKSVNLSSILCGHEVYRAYFYRFWHKDSPYCAKCQNIAKDAEHVLLQCPRFAALETIMEYRLKSKGIWIEVGKVIAVIRRKLSQSKEGTEEKC